MRHVQIVNFILIGELKWFRLHSFKYTERIFS